MRRFQVHIQSVCIVQYSVRNKNLANPICSKFWGSYCSLYTTACAIKNYFLEKKKPTTLEYCWCILLRRFCRKKYLSKCWFKKATFFSPSPPCCRWWSAWTRVWRATWWQSATTCSCTTTPSTGGGRRGWTRRKVRTITIIVFKFA